MANFRDMQVSPKMAILGDMKELGDVSAEEHQKLVDAISACSLDEVWLVGSEFAKTQCPFRKFNDVEEVKKAIAENRPEGYYILIKGSNSIKLLSFLNCCNNSGDCLSGYDIMARDKLFD